MSREMGRLVSADREGNNKGFTKTASWSRAVRELTCGVVMCCVRRDVTSDVWPDEGFVQKLVSVHQILDRIVVEKAPAVRLLFAAERSHFLVIRCAFGWQA